MVVDPVLRCAIAIALIALPAMVSAGAFPPIAFLSMGFKEAKLSDFRGTPEMTYRKADASGFLSVSADFNGDGMEDEARILLNGQRNIAYVVAVIVTANKVDTYVLSDIQLPEVSQVGIRALAPRSIGPMPSSAGIGIFNLRTGQGEANYFDGEEFNIRFPLKGDSKA